MLFENGQPKLMPADQNHPPERRKKVVQALARSDDQDAREIARLMGRIPEGEGR